MWQSITRLSVSQHFKVTQCLHLQRPFWRHSDTSQKIWNLSQNCNKQTNTKHDLWLTHVWSPVTNKMSWRQWTNKHHNLLGAAHTDSLKDKLTALRSIQNDGNAFHIYYPVQCTKFFLPHCLIITWWNEQTQQSTVQRMTMYVYLQFITDSTEIYSQWHLQQNDATRVHLPEMYRMCGPSVYRVSQEERT
jgi:hypothetical protein